MKKSENDHYSTRRMCVLFVLFVVLLVVYVAASWSAPIPFVDSPQKFAKSMRAFLAARDANDPLSWKWTNSYSKNEAVFAYRHETMVLYENKFKARCVKLATRANDKGLREMCGTAHHPSHLKRIAEEFEKISEAEK